MQPPLILLTGPIYRFFRLGEHANALCKGHVWLSTLEECRRYEDAEQGDAEEAHHTYHSGFLRGDGTDDEFVQLAQRAGVQIGPGSADNIVWGNTRTEMLSDAFVLCTTTEFTPEKMAASFGTACVRIDKPRRFLDRVTLALRRQHRIREAMLGQVAYKDRSFRSTEPPPGLLGFVKPAYPYGSQNEVRFLWTSHTRSIRPFLLDVPSVASLCRRVA